MDEQEELDTDMQGEARGQGGVTEGARGEVPKLEQSTRKRKAPSNVLGDGEANASRKKDSGTIVRGRPP
eukprot:gene5524-11131_t